MVIFKLLNISYKLNMKDNTQEKSLVQINKNSIFYKIKRFLKKIFNGNNMISDNYTTAEKTKSLEEDKREAFLKNIKNIETEETILLKLQKQYRSGEIKEEELSEEQVNSLCNLYDIQITNLRKSNEIRKQKLLNHYSTV